MYSEQLAFYQFLLTGVWESVPVLESSISEYLCDTRIFAGNGNGHGGSHSPPPLSITRVLAPDGSVTYLLYRLEPANKARQHDEAPAARWSQTEARYHQLLDAAPDAMVVVGPDGDIAFVNARTESLFAYSRSELLGQRLEVLLPPRFRHIHGQHLVHYFATAHPRPAGSGLEIFGLRKDGGEFPIEVSLSPLRSEEGVTVLASIRDISERKRLEDASRLLANRLTSAVESIQDAFALFDGEDRLVLCNSVYRRLIGASLPGALVGRPYAQLLDAWLGDIVFQDEAERQRFRAERLARRSEGQLMPIDVHMRDGRHLRVVDRRTVEGGIVKTVWDLTEDVHLAEELREARIAADAASTAKSQFVASMSHELRTPLNAILGFAQLLQRDRKAPLAAHHLTRVGHILNGGEHLLKLIDDILDLSRIEAGSVAIAIEPVSVADLVREVTTALEVTAAQNKISITVTPIPRECSVMLADHTRALQILSNLASNAVKYNRHGGQVQFIVSAPCPGRVRVTVADTGIGVPAAKQCKLFQPFQRAGQENGSIQGTGIGLVITRRLAQLMSGNVDFTSVEGQGSQFWLDLPMHQTIAPAAVPVAAREGPQRIVGEGRHLVLFIEDNLANIDFVKELVSDLEDIDLLTAPTAELGVELARVVRPAVIIMDINLPGMSGLDALRVLRATAETRTIPVVALTAAASERDRQQGLAAGFDRYLTKPVRVDELERTLDEMLSGLANPL